MDNNLDSFAYTPEDSALLFSLDTILTHEDISFIIQQLKNINDFKLEQVLLIGKRVISSDTLKSLRAPFDTAFWKIPHDISFWKRLKDRYGVEDFLTVSKPLFSKDEKKVILITRYYRVDWGSGETLLLVKDNGTWKYKQQIDYWEN